MYELTDYNGQKIAVTEEQAAKIAAKAKLIPIKVNGKIHYLKESNIASIKPTRNYQDIVPPSKQIEAPDYRGQPSAGKDKARKMVNEMIAKAAKKKSIQVD